MDRRGDVTDANEANPLDAPARPAPKVGSQRSAARAAGARSSCAAVIDPPAPAQAVRLSVRGEDARAMIAATNYLAGYVYVRRTPDDVVVCVGGGGEIAGWNWGIVIVVDDGACGHGTPTCRPADGPIGDGGGV